MLYSQQSTIDLAKEVLEKNWRDGYTIPSNKLYPFQWNWDSGFIALGLAYFDKHKAIDEIKSLFKGQWKNGMVPHIIFHKPDPNYFPGPDAWGTDKYSGVSQIVQTSGITQPPVFGFILEMMDKIMEGHDQWKNFVKEIFPKVVDFHRYLYKNRDPLNEGLVYIHHNWESGTDNSPMWDDILENIDVSKARDVSALRRDLKNVDSSQRPTNEHYKRYMYLVDMFIENEYSDEEIYKKCPFLVQDVLFNSLLARSNDGLIIIGEKYGFDTVEVNSWNEKTKASINSKMWDEEKQFYFSYDLKNNRKIPVKVSSGFMPLFAGIASTDQAKALVNHLMNSFIKSSDWALCPSCAADEDSFNAVKYWRGPVWINVNWMIFLGLKRYGFIEEAEKIKKDTFYLVEEHGMYEYFDPRPENEGGLKQRGIGGEIFSWTAALYLDLVYSH